MIGMLDEVGTNTLTATQMQRRIGARTGGLSAALALEQPSGGAGRVSDTNSLVANLAIRGKSTVHRDHNPHSVSASLTYDGGRFFIGGPRSRDVRTDPLATCRGEPRRGAGQGGRSAPGIGLSL